MDVNSVETSSEELLTLGEYPINDKLSLIVKENAEKERFYALKHFAVSEEVLFTEDTFKKLLHKFNQVRL